jgi:hypothetical protein
MARKKWVAKTEITPALLKFREKRKWQIALRRYVLQKQTCVPYAPYFGLDIEHMRQWFEMQFHQDISWDGFGKYWQFDHIIPVTYFDFSLESELKMCWNFTNIRVEHVQSDKDTGNKLDMLAAKRFFQNIYDSTRYKPCGDLMDKIAQLEKSEAVSSAKQEDFLNNNRSYLAMIENYSAFEFELLNSGRTVEEVIKEVSFLKKF